MEGRNSFTFYRSFYEAANQLSKRSRLGLYEAILAYALDEVEPELTDKKQKAAFILIKPVLDTGRKKALAGQLGGNKPKAKRKQTESKGEIEKENENEVEIENEIEIEVETQMAAGLLQRKPCILFIGNERAVFDPGTVVGQFPLVQ